MTNEPVSGRPRHAPILPRSQQIFSKRECNEGVDEDSDRNERLTAASGAVLFVLLAALGITILSIHQLLSAHFFIGMLLIPVVLVKLGSTGWRFARYYRGSPGYVAKGPPLLPLRLLAPVVVLSTIAVFATGVALLVQGPQHGFVLGLHKASFVVWLGATGIHVLAYLRRVPRLAASARAPWLLVAAAVVAGAILAVATVHDAGPWAHLRQLDG